ncbi:MAG: efflux RND transporter periplasmic adaptor subunit [Pseudomonadota bacterium]|jgi:RND family efflux transporter MFP subunit
MNNPYGREPLSRREKVALIVTAITVLFMTCAVAAYFYFNRPQAERRRPTPNTLIVDVRELTPTSYQITIPVMGSVVPDKEIDLKSRVAGEVVWTNPAFEEGGIVKDGQVLVRIDATEYELALVQKKAVLESAILDLKTEEGRQEIARSEWELLGLEDKATEMDRELALRKPQLAAFRANLEAARAGVKQAELDLKRTVITAPFNALVRSTDVNIGSQVTVQGTLAHLVGSDTFFIEALIPLDRLSWVHIPENPTDNGSKAVVRSGTGRVVTGRIYKLLGDLETDGRLARILIEISDPLDLERQNGDRKPLLLGDYVNASIYARSVEDVFVIDRKYLKEGNKVYIAGEDDRLRIKPVEIIWNGADNILARGLEQGEELIVSDVPAPVEGMKIRIQGKENNPDTEEKGTREKG